MRLFRALIAVAVLCAPCLQAKADDFQMIVIDPDPGGFTVHDIYAGPSFQFSFATCDPGQNAPSAFVGCFSGVNLTGSTITALSIAVGNLVPDGQGGNQPAGCDASVSADSQGPLFGTCDPVQETNGYLVAFSDGKGIKPGVLFTIAEQGAPPAAFGSMTATITTAVAATPEPESLTLLATGMLSTGGYLFRRRRSMRK